MFWIVWKGKGIFVPIIFFAVLYAYFYVFVSDPSEKVINSKGCATALVITGLLCFLLARRWKRKYGRVYFDEKKNREIVVRPDHSFYLLNVYYWSFILTGLGLLCFYFILF
ncbi:hypothetical protein [Flavobacterium sp.]|uniref:hypothetical protein n=1 Tax=Flavobacterium sp. TaxID=239 RepID=UPI001206A3D6|nr:hypothetical protein [Flavobacterium sp.]RZJ70738.1 MAG: hypothetical protein EOO49_12865 [Flavobacterium sp.]